MVSRHQMLISALLFEFMLFPLVGATYSMPNIKNPITDIIGQDQNTNGYGITAGTAQGPGDTTTPQAQAQAVQSCVVGGVPGAIGGGMLLGSVFPVIGTFAGFIVGALVGGAVGCTTTSTFFPQQGSNVFTILANKLPGPLGDFVRALGIALSFLGPMLSFLSDSINYEFALLANAPQIGIFLAPVQLITAFLLFFEAALYIRGTGSTG